MAKWRKKVWIFHCFLRTRAEKIRSCSPPRFKFCLSIGIQQYENLIWKLISQQFVWFPSIPLESPGHLGQLPVVQYPHPRLFRLIIYFPEFFLALNHQPLHQLIKASFAFRVRWLCLWALNGLRSCLKTIFVRTLTWQPLAILYLSPAARFRTTIRHHRPVFVDTH